MNKKIAFILAPILGCFALIGATFAAWAVTDNANPLGIKITPKENSTEEYSTMLLEWGDTKKFTDLSNFELGESKAKSSELEVVSTVTEVPGEETHYTGGNLSLAFEDRTAVTKPAGAADLIDYLVVEAYKARSGSAGSYTYDPSDLIVACNQSSDDHKANADYETATGVKTPVYFKIYISDKHSDGVTEVTAKEFNEMKEDLVYLTVGWDKPKDMPAVESTTIYYQTSESDVKVYAWNSKTMDNNGAWPGVLMDKVVGNYYSYALSAQFDRVVFSWGNHDDDHKTLDLTVPTTIAQTPFWNGSEWAVKPEMRELSYSVIGTFNNWTAADGIMTKVNENKFTLDITAEAGCELKVMASDNMTFYGGSDGSEKGTSEGTHVFVLGEAGTYTITFIPNPTKSESTGKYYYVSSVKK